jgi:ABC-type phosphate/phosphonate transport system substrate-binding protein
MIAALPMYDRPETAAANDRLWARVRSALGYGQMRLDRAKPNWEVWQHDALLLSQTCGLPYRAGLHDRVHLIGTPDYGLPDTTPGYYHSIFVVRRGASENLTDYGEKHFAFSGSDSQSGWAGPLRHLAAKNLNFGQHTATGGHRASARTVAEGNADFTALDAQSWRMIVRYDGFASDLIVIDRTEETPGLPLITGLKFDPKTLSDVFADAISSMSSDDRETLNIYSLRHISKKDYLAISEPPRPKNSPLQP